jgi:hypothetical protein
LRLIEHGELLIYLRFPPSPSPNPNRVWTTTLIRPSAISLGRAIVAFYIIVLLTAVIWARSPVEKEPVQPEVRAVDSHQTAPSSFDL